MLSFAPYIAAATLALHTLLGCCWHHAHADADQNVLGCHEHHSEDHSPVDHDHDHPPCNQGGCVFVKCERQTHGLASLAFDSLAIAESPLANCIPMMGAPSEDPTPTIEPQAHFLCARLRC